MTRRLVFSVLFPALLCFHVAAADVWIPLGPDGGQVLQLVKHPLKDGVLFSVTDLGGVFKSTDTGATWDSASTGIVSAGRLYLAISSSDPALLYLYCSWDKSFYTSLDEASTWQRINVLTSPPFPNALEVDRQNPSRVLMGGGNYSDGRVWSSSDGGLTWKKLVAVDREVTALWVSGDTILAGTSYGGVYRSTDGGSTWSRRNLSDTVMKIVGVSTLYAAASGGIYKSTDMGKTWLEVHYWGGESIVIDPADEKRVITISNWDILQTTDGGKTWTILQEFGTSEGNDIALDSTSGAIIAATRQGIIRSTDAGTTWALSNSGLKAAIIDFAVARNDPGIIYARERWSGLLRSTDAGMTWAPFNNLPEPYPGALAVDPLNSNRLYIEIGTHLYRTEDGGGSWILIAHPEESISDLTVTPSGMVLAGTNYGWIFKSTNQGVSWSRSLGGCGEWVINTDYSPVDPDLLWAACGNGQYPGEDATILRSTNAGRSWEETIDFGYNFSVHSVTAHPAEPDMAYAGTEFGLHRTTDRGLSWHVPSACVSGEGVQVAFDPLNTNHGYMIGGNGIYKTTDLGISWRIEMNGLPPYVLPRSLEIASVGSPRVFLSTSGTGVFALQEDTAHMPQYFVEDFSDGIPDWTYLKGQWTEECGRLISEPGARSAVAVASPVFSGCSECSIYTEFVKPGPGKEGKVSLLGWYQDEDNFVELSLDFEQRIFILKQFVNGSVAAKSAQRDLLILPDLINYVWLSFDGNQFAARVSGGHKELTMNTAARPFGTVGFRAKGSPIAVRLIQVTR